MAYRDSNLSSLKADMYWAKKELQKAKNLLHDKNVAIDYYKILIGFGVDSRSAYNMAVRLDFKSCLGSKEFSKQEKEIVESLRSTLCTETYLNTTY